MSLRNIAHNAVKSAVQQKRIQPARLLACVDCGGGGLSDESPLLLLAAAMRLQPDRLRSVGFFFSGVRGPCPECAPNPRSQQERPGERIPSTVNGIPYRSDRHATPATPAPASGADQPARDS